MIRLESIGPLRTDWQLASVGQLAKALGIASNKILTWIRDCQLVAFNIATRTTTRPIFRIDRADFDNFWNGRRTSPPAAKVATSRRRSVAKNYF